MKKKEKEKEKEGEVLMARKNGRVIGASK